ncbi:MAG: hypothetical protein SFX18_07650 [Pirellulales bacterium]|nr:hypothetical protein [Pirellulales bacterium]
MSRRLLNKLLSAVILGGGLTLGAVTLSAQVPGGYDVCEACQACPECAQPWSICDLIQPSDVCYQDFISPMTNPVFFEDPRMLTEARLIYIHHTLPELLGGGDVDLIALQLRAKLTERLSLIANKDGFIFYGDDVGFADDGWADVGLGLKYLIYGDPTTQTIVSGGVSLELPVGSTRALQGNGDGEYNLFLTAGQEFWGNWHYLTATGLRLPGDRQSENQVFYWSHHIDYQFAPTWYAFGELNWYHYMSDTAAGGVPGINGLDLYNLGSANVAGLDIVTMAFGLKKRFGSYNELGVAYELPVTDEEDLLHNRFTFDLILRY